ncbi:MAG: SCO1664 family protein [Anaerolineales bacterium]
MTAPDPDVGDSAARVLSTPAALAALGRGDLELQGLLPWGSNYTFLVTIRSSDLQFPAVYKPDRGERPLWDFPPGTLGKREVAAYFVSEKLGWGFVPPTVYRDGPHGAGSVQLFIDFDPNEHYFNFSGERKLKLHRVVLFDYITNNADRKGGHVIIDSNQRLWLLDHGICFHADYKLRTVIWDFAGLPVPDEMLAEMKAFEALFADGSDLVPSLHALLSVREVEAIRRRTRALLESGCFPRPGPGRNYPWPPL